MSTIILSIKEIYTNAIASGEKDHEFRSRLPRKVPHTMIVYVTHPVAMIKYVLSVDKPVAHPNQIPLGGLGNDIFNDGLKRGKFAYPITKVFELKTPLSLKDARELCGFNAPQAFTYLEKYPRLEKWLIGADMKILNTTNPQNDKDRAEL